ncbi:MAG: hypothetical protein K0U98_09250 [Deltaproteobacteria bacterium]|nr:hypothetical protein [Deltaproteobacteria bacterium]
MRSTARNLKPRDGASWLGMAALLGTGLAASFAADWQLTEKVGGDLRSTLVAIPALVAALWAVDLYCRRSGGRGISRQTSQAQLVAVAVLGSLGLYQHDLGLELASPVLAAGFFFVLAHRVWRQLLAARPLLGHSLQGRPSLLFFVLPLVAYLALLPWTTQQRPPDGDEPYYLLVAHSLAYDLDTDLTNNYLQGDGEAFLGRSLKPQAGDPVGPGGELYSRHNDALPILLAPFYRLAGKGGALTIMGILAALLAWTTLRLARHYFPQHPGEALVAYGWVAFTPPLLLYSTQIWVEVPAALLSMVVLDNIPRRETATRWTRKEWIVIGIPILLLPLIKIRFMLLAVSLLLIAWWYARRPWKPLLVLCMTLGALGGGILSFNQAKYGNPLKIHTMEELALHERTLADYAEGGLGLFFDSAFGLFPSSPIWFLVLPGIFLALHRKYPLLRDLLLLGGPYLLIVAPRGEWYGGWSPPFRYGLFMLPLLGLLLIPLLAQRRQAGARMLLAALGLLTLLLTALWFAVPGWTYNFADGRTYLLDHLGRLLGADVARLFPSSVRPRLATWLWPPLAALAVGLLWWWPRPAIRTWRNLTTTRQAGAVLLFLALGFLPLVAKSLPTKLIEVEDAQVKKQRGHPFPDRWIIERTRYRGGWVLRPGESVTAPVVAGGRRVAVRLDLQYVRNSDWPIRLLAKSGDRLLGRWRPQDSRNWTEWELAPMDWTDGDSLVLEVVAASPRGDQSPNGIVIDRVELRWLD